MIIDIVDASDNPVGIIERDEVLRAHANFRVSHVLLFNSEKELLLQRLAFTRKRHPGAWGSSVAAYVMSGETYSEAARRRTAQELGLELASLDHLGKIQMRDEDSLKFISVFQGFAQGAPWLESSHIAQIEFVAIPDIVRMIKNAERIFTPTFIRVFEFYQSLHLS